jgi:hypothetical protein
VNPHGHSAKAKEIRQSLDRLLPDPTGVHVAAITELAFGIAHHLIAVGAASKFGQHLDTHEGIARLLRQNQASEIAEAFERLDQLRVGRWYGGKGDGKAVEECLALLKQIENWSR